MNEFSFPDLIVFSHLRWDFVFQRPQHLMTRYAKMRKVFFFEEPIFQEIEMPSLQVIKKSAQLSVITPHLPHGLDENQIVSAQQDLIDDWLEDSRVKEFHSWYYTPMALEYTRHLEPKRIIYDCMDELSAFRGAHPRMLELERELMAIADLVFTGGQSLFEAKKNRHPQVHCFPSSIDGFHFRKARAVQAEPKDQAWIKGTKIGFFGVIDERFDIELLRESAELRPEWQFIIIGPVVKIHESALPKNLNIHYLGMKLYEELPAYLSGWSLAILPFAKNESTKFISPTKTPEYLSAGVPVVSTSIRDVIQPYAEKGLVHIADTASEFIEAAQLAMTEARWNVSWIEEVDHFLADKSWDATCEKMLALEKKSSEENKIKELNVQSVPTFLIAKRSDASFSLKA